jgi:hypothetical protein
MPFSKQFEDHYYYGIRKPVEDCGFLCIRADKEYFVGDIMSWIQRHINESSVVIADLSGASANVYLEVGYAWGVGKPCILLARRGEELRFDVSGHRCIYYDSIMELETELTKLISTFVA